ncbi:MAG TPA: DegT/DnrJ/EryC1/StrS family aminotransferase, partial [Ktedonobacteraceae bacterium]
MEGRKLAQAVLPGVDIPRTRFLPFAVPHITQEEIDEVVDTLRSGWLTTGQKTKRFEREFAQVVDAPYAVAT